MRHILFMLDHFHPFVGGVETLFDEVSSFCAQQNIKVTILTSRHSSDLKSVEKRGDVTIYRVGRGRYSVGFAQLWFCLWHRELLQSVDHIHTSTFASCLAAWLVAKWYDKSITLTIHELYHEWWYHLKKHTARLFVWYEALICRLPWTKITTVSQTSKRDILCYHPHLREEDIQVIVNKIDGLFWDPSLISQDQQDALRSQYNLKVSDKIILFAGRL